MVADITKGIHLARANYLVALGMLSYIEAIGGLISGDGGLIYRVSQTNFEAALNEMPPAYRAFPVTISRPGAQSGSGIYEILRCGMVHQYAPTEELMVYARPGGRAARGRIGFEWETLLDGSQRLAINTNELLRDFKFLLVKVSGWIRTQHPNHYPNIKKTFERIDGLRALP